MTALSPAALKEKLLAREASLFHACQLRDLCSYVVVGGVPSRAVLQAMPHTPFVTDQADQANDVWDKVFFNLADFGRTFALGGAAVPNPYGPICIQLSPPVLDEVDDVAVCLRSAGATGFNRSAEALTLEDLAMLFAYPPSSGFPSSTEVRYGRQLQDLLPGRLITSAPEVSAGTKTGVVSFGAAVAIWLDRYDIPLADRINACAPSLARLVRIRSYARGRGAVSVELGREVAGGVRSLMHIAESSHVSEATRAWARSAQGNNLDWQFQRYAEYLRVGTLAVN